MPESNPFPRSRAAIVARKEFREIFRDRRTIMNVVVSPLIITPLLFALIGMAVKGQVEKAKSQTYTVALVGSVKDEATAKALKAMPNLKIEEAATQAEAEQGIQKHKFVAAALLPSDPASHLQAEETVPIKILIDKGDEKSQMAGGAIEDDLRQMEQKIVTARIAAHQLPKTFASAFQITTQAIPGSGGGAMVFLAHMLPYMLIFAAFGGAIYAAFDQVAGEKERGTLETLLVAPLSRRDIVLGKFAAVVGVCLVSCVLSIVGLAIPFMSGLKAFEWLAKGGVSLSPAALFVILLVLIPISVLFAGMLLAVSTYARNQKEAQTYLLTLFPIVFIPALFSMLLDSDVGRSIALVPILNGSIIIKQALNGNYDPVFIGLAFATSVGYAAIALIFATHLFQKESVLIKT